ncbi:hypothetical protein F4680DRAFT_446571 [Xylaria scruposa]|nr:hypothetical protein F4680DRAFT_446571 [Xylaria scruposa]
MERRPYANNEGLTGLFAAVKHGHTDVIDILLKNGVNPNHINADGDTVLLNAIAYDREDSTLLLIKAGALGLKPEWQRHTTIAYANALNRRSIAAMPKQHCTLSNAYYE